MESLLSIAIGFESDPKSILFSVYTTVMPKGLEQYQRLIVQDTVQRQGERESLFQRAYSVSRQDGQRVGGETEATREVACPRSLNRSETELGIEYTSGVPIQPPSH